MKKDDDNAAAARRDEAAYGKAWRISGLSIDSVEWKIRIETVFKLIKMCMMIVKCDIIQL